VAGCQALGVVVAFALVFVISSAVFALIKATLGLRSRPRRRGWTSRRRGCTATPELYIPAAEIASPAPIAGTPSQARPSWETGDDVKKIEAFIRHEAFEPIRTELLERGFPSMSIAEYKGSGRQRGITEHYRGAELTIHLRPKLKVEIVVESDDLEVVKEVILKHARTGRIGDGKIFVLPVEEAVRIRTGEEGERVLQAHEAEEVPRGA
jgi:nitrogen regulatory protein P-II 1